MENKISKTKYEDLKIHENHELALEEVKGFGLILRCLDCKEQLLNFEVEEEKEYKQKCCDECDNSFNCRDLDGDLIDEQVKSCKGANHE